MATAIPKRPKKERNQITIRLDREVLENSGALLPISGIQPRLGHQTVPHICLSQRQSVYDVASGPGDRKCSYYLRRRRGNSPDNRESQAQEWASRTRSTGE